MVVGLGMSVVLKMEIVNVIDGGIDDVGVSVSVLRWCWYRCSGEVVMNVMFMVVVVTVTAVVTIVMM